jgi:hypothetical protein
MAKGSAVETAKYVRAQTKELARLSRDAGLDILAYLLEVAVLEAEAQIMASRKNAT